MTPRRPSQDPKDDRSREDERAALAADVARANDRLAAPGHEASPDAAVLIRAATRAVQEGRIESRRDYRAAREALRLGLARLDARSEGKPSVGGTVRGYVSEVDGSIQPYAIYVPETYDGRTATRLDVILHGRNDGLNEAGFVLAHDGKPYPEGESGLLLHVFGRGNNAYRWAGEADVFEAIRAVSKHYRVDPRRVLLRGFSMGGAGAWHLGLHHPREWAAVEAGAGFSESKVYAKLNDLPPWQEATLHIYDAVDYALNAFDVPIAGYGGEQDKQLQASTNIVQALEGLGVTMETEGLVTTAKEIEFIRVVGARMGHKVDPASESILKAFRDEHAAVGQPTRPAPIKFVTYTLAYHQAPWLSVQGLGEHYRRARIEAEVIDDEVFVSKVENISMLAVDRETGATIRLEDRSLPLRDAVDRLLPRVYYRRVEAGWEVLDYEQSRELQQNLRRRKRPGLQGPIDHAFMGPFLCVRGTGRPWHPNVQHWAEARLARFADDWRTFLRGELRIKDDSEVTEDDADRFHLVLFGDPGSNSLIERLLPDLPVEWTNEHVSVAGGERFPAADHAPALITASPIDPLRYVVLNSGHTFDASAFRGTNALLYPRLGDFAMLRVRNKGEDVLESGFFGEDWKPKVSPPGR